MYGNRDAAREATKQLADASESGRAASAAATPAPAPTGKAPAGRRPKPTRWARRLPASAGERAQGAGGRTGAAAAPAAHRRPAAPAAGGDDKYVYYLQAGAFREMSDAENTRAKLALLGFEAAISDRTSDSGVLHRVRLGPYSQVEADEQGARQAARQRHRRRHRPQPEIRKNPMRNRCPAAAVTAALASPCCQPAATRRRRKKAPITRRCPETGEHRCRQEGRSHRVLRLLLPALQRVRAAAGRAWVKKQGNNIVFKRVHIAQRRPRAAAAAPVLRARRARPGRAVPHQGLRRHAPARRCASPTTRK